jgi:Matrixin
VQAFRRTTVAGVALGLVLATAFALPASGRQPGRGHPPSADGARAQRQAVVNPLRPTRVGPPLGACVAAGDDDPLAFLVGGGQMNTSSPLPVTLSTASPPSGVTSAGFQAALNDAILQWEGTALGDAFGTPTLTSDPVAARRDGTSTVSFSRKRVGSAVGLTILQQFDSSGNLTEADTILNSKYPWSLNTTFSANPDTAGTIPGCAGDTGKFDVEAVLVHELGHWVRLEHVLNNFQTMYPSIGTGELRKRNLAQGDINGVDDKY